MHFILKSIAFVFMISSAALAGEPLIFTEDMDAANAAANLLYIEDARGSAEFEDVVSEGGIWTPNKKTYMAFGFSRSAYWFKFTIDQKSPSARKLFMEINLSNIDFLDVYIPDGKGSYDKIETGDHLPFSSRKIDHPNFVFPMVLEPGLNDIYFRLETSSPIEFRVNISTLATLISKSQRETAIIWALYGFLLMVAIYNFSVFVITRDYAYLHLVLYALTFLGMYFHHLGQARQFICPNSVRGSHLLLALFMSLNIAFSGTFTSSFMQTRRKYPRIHKAIIIFLIAPGFLYAGLSFFLPYDVIASVCIKHSFLACLFLLAVFSYMIFKKDRSAVFLMAGYFIVIMSGMATILILEGILPPNMYSKWMLLFGAAWLMLSFSVGLADRINAMKRNLEKSQAVVKTQNRELLSANAEMRDRNIELTEMHSSLEISEQRFRSMIDQSPMVIELYDSRGSLVQTNKIREDTWGDYGPVDGKPFNIFQSDEITGLPIFPMIKDVFEGAPPVVKEWTLYAKGDSGGAKTRAYRTRVYGVRTSDGALRNVVIMHEDVTREKQAEEMLIQSEKMMSVGGLAAGMAHEINNPLAGMLQNAQVAIQRLSQPLPANLKCAEEMDLDFDSLAGFMEKRGIIDSLKSITDSGARAAQIVRNMLSFSRKGGAAPEKCDLSQLLDKTVELAGSDFDLKKKYDFKAISIIREYDENLPMVLCEAGKIQQVFLNILKNGAQAMNENADSRNCEPCFYFKTSRQNGSAEVEIRDNGPGMDEDTRKSIFEPFFTTKGPEEGTGMGLSLSAYIITENHGGSIRVETLPGRGTSFIITLPIEGKP